VNKKLEFFPLSSALDFLDPIFLEKIFNLAYFVFFSLMIDHQFESKLKNQVSGI
jgi:hypothetical protein